MITYYWDCTRVDAYPEYETGGDTYPDVVFYINWKVIATSDVLDPEGIPYTTYNENSIEIDVRNITDFIPFSELTNEISVGWTKSTMGVDGVALVEEGLAYGIEQLINPPAVSLVIGE